MVLTTSNDESEKDSDVELTPLTSETSEVEPEQTSDISETLQPEVVTDESLDSEMTQESSDIKPENDEAFNRDDFIDDLFGVAPATDALLDESLETTDEALIDELMTSDGNDLLPAIEEPIEQLIDNTVEPEQAPLSNNNEVSKRKNPNYRLKMMNWISTRCYLRVLILTKQILKSEFKKKPHNKNQSRMKPTYKIKLRHPL